MYCLRCGSTLSADGPFCPQCGTQVPEWQWHEMQETQNQPADPAWQGEGYGQARGPYERQDQTWEEPRWDARQDPWQGGKSTYGEPWQYGPGYEPYYGAYPVQPKSQIITLLLAIFFGYLGIHRFYVGKHGTGVFWLFTAGMFAFGWIADIVSIASGNFRDHYGRPLY